MRNGEQTPHGKFSDSAGKDLEKLNERGVFEAAYESKNLRANKSIHCREHSAIKRSSIVISGGPSCFSLSLFLSLFIPSPFKSRFRCTPALRFSVSLARADWLQNRPIINLSSGFPWKAKPVRWRVIGRCQNHSTARINQVCGPSITSHLCR